MILAEYFPADTSQTIANYMVTLFVLVLTIYFIYGYHSKNVEPHDFSNIDNFDLGYIRDEQPQVVVDVEYDELKDLERKVKIAKLKKQLNDLNSPKPKPETTKTTKQSKASKPAIFDDCVSALVGLGSPVRKAKAEAQVIFEKNPNIKTVQEFITEYGKQ
jgi:hypothetical protein|tara:strand:+ start:922 stop:1401 length:480 start_codon:yes stop_codon:yes gene_type:complete